MADFDRDAVIEQASAGIRDAFYAEARKDRVWPPAAADAHEMIADGSGAAAALPGIVAATLAPIEALRQHLVLHEVGAEQMVYARDLMQAIADIKAKAGA